MAIENDPRPVLRQELARVFKNQRVIRAFEKIFDLIPPEFIDQQIQIDTISLISELAASQTNEAAAAVSRLASAIELLALQPPAKDFAPLIGLEPNTIPSIDQTIAPIWTATHTFTSSGGGAPGVHLSSAAPTFTFTETDGAADGKRWDVTINAGNIAYRTVNDALSLARNYFSITRAGLAITDISFGNATDNPTFNFLGTGTPKHGGGQLMQGSAGFTNNAAAAAGTLLNAPIAGNPTKWIPINDNGTIRNIPAW